MTRSRIPLCNPDEIDGERSNAVIHGVLLAAGTSSRYGDANKLLTTIGGELLVRRAARTLTRSAIDDTTVVLGYEADHVRRALADLDVSVTVNTAYDDGQSTSVCAGVRAAQERNADAVLVALADMPDVSIDTVNAVLDVYKRTPADVIAPAYDGRRGNPVLFDARYFDPLTDLSGDIGGREIFLSSDDTVFVETDDPGVRRDIDRPNDR